MSSSKAITFFFPFLMGGGHSQPLSFAMTAAVKSGKEEPSASTRLAALYCVVYCGAQKSVDTENKKKMSSGNKSSWTASNAEQVKTAGVWCEQVYHVFPCR